MIKSELYFTKILNLKTQEIGLLICLWENKFTDKTVDFATCVDRTGKRYNIDLVQRRKVHYLRQDKELEQEYLTYAWRKKKDGRIIDEPEDGNDHIMDAIAYAVRDMERKPIVYAGIRWYSHGEGFTQP